MIDMNTDAMKIADLWVIEMKVLLISIEVKKRNLFFDDVEEEFR